MAARNSVPYSVPASTGWPRASANWPNRPTQAFRSEVKLFAWLMPAKSPAGVVTRSTSGCRALSLPSSTTVAKMEVPADTLPVRLRTELVAIMPVPASPSGGASVMPRLQGAGRVEQLGALLGEFAGRGAGHERLGQQVLELHGWAATSGSSLNWRMNSASQVRVVGSIGNMPEASPTPSTFLPVSFQCT